MKIIKFSANQFLSMSLLIILLLVASCTSEWRRNKEYNVWSSSNPMAIPYSQRIIFLKKGNLVKNNSFENGTITLANDTLTKQQIHTWEIIGDSVEYFENGTDSAQNNIAFEGKRAVRIQCRRADETDTLGKGILSDFIEVIPGNYEFTAGIKLEKIKPQLERLGTKIFDAINIRLFCYDENKKPIINSMYYPYTKVHLNNSFKGYSFSNYYYIDSFGWDKINCRSYNYPFSDGDLPDNTKYVKIFAGLKGVGTMWIDDIEFKYSKWNFSTAERMGWYKDSVYSAVQMIIPTPKFAKELETIKLADEQRKPVIINDFGKSNRVDYSLNYLNSVIQKSVSSIESSYNTLVVKSNDVKAIANASIIFRLTSYSKISMQKHEENMKEIAQKEQGYIIYDSISEGKHIITIAAGDDYGLYYGVTTLSRLMPSEKNQLQNAYIIDFPDYLGRGYQLTPWKTQEDIQKDIQNFDYLSFYRLNKAYLPYYQSDEGKRWFAPREILHQGTKEIGDYLKKNQIMQLCIMFNPYNHFEYEMLVSSMNDSLKYIFQHNEAGMEMIKKALKPAFDNGAVCLMLLADDFVPHSEDYRKLYSLWTPEDIKKHTNLQNAQAYMVNSLYTWLKKYGKVRIEFCPPWYLNEFIDKSRGYAEQYFRDLRKLIPEDVNIIWTGNTVRSLSFDKADLKRYADLCGRTPMLWDNTLYARGLEGTYGGYPAYYPEKAALCNIFEPFDVGMPKDYFIQATHIYTNGGPSSEIYKIKYATVADFEWNTTAYNPEKSLWKILLGMFGKQTAWSIVEWNDAYYKALGKCMIAEQKNDSAKISTELKQYQETLQKNHSELSKLLESLNPALNKEISDLTSKLDIRIQQLIDTKQGKEKSGKEQI